MYLTVKTYSYDYIFMNFFHHVRFLKKTLNEHLNKYFTLIYIKSVISFSFSKFGESACLILFLEDELEICSVSPLDVAFSTSDSYSWRAGSSISGAEVVLSANETSSQVIPPSVSILCDGFL